MILATRFTFIVERSWKNMYFHPKLAWPPATYDVISRNHSNWPSLNSSQNLCEGWTNSYWKRQVLIFYTLGKNSDKPYGVGGWHPHLPPLYVRQLTLSYVYTIPDSFLCRYEKLFDIVWPATAQDCNKSFTQVAFVPERLAERIWSSKSLSSLPGSNTYVQNAIRYATLHFRVALRCFPLIKKSQRNHSSLKWTEVLSGMVFVPAQELSGIVWT